MAKRPRTIHIDDHVWAAIRYWAKAEGVTASHLVEHAMTNLLLDTVAFGETKQPKQRSDWATADQADSGRHS